MPFSFPGAEPKRPGNRSSISFTSGKTKWRRQQSIHRSLFFRRAERRTADTFLSSRKEHSLLKNEFSPWFWSTPSMVVSHLRTTLSSCSRSLYWSYLGVVSNAKFISYQKSTQRNICLIDLRRKARLSGKFTQTSLTKWCASMVSWRRAI